MLGEIRETVSDGGLPNTGRPRAEVVVPDDERAGCSEGWCVAYTSSGMSSRALVNHATRIAPISVRCPPDAAQDFSSCSMKVSGQISEPPPASYGAALVKTSLTKP
jgi:hypothetical protein